jgi:hypothetical protein
MNYSFFSNLYLRYEDILVIRVPKNASTTLCKLLNVDYGDFKHIHDINIDGIKKIFCFIRDPKDRMFSCWYNRIVKKYMGTISGNEFLENTTFEEFIKIVYGKEDYELNPHVRSQTKIINDCNLNLNNYELVFINTDEIENNWDYITTLFKNKIPYVKLNNSDDIKRNDYFNDEILNLINERFNSDYELLKNISK